MRCYDLDEYLSDYLEDALSLEKTEELLAHLEKCDACRAEFQAYKTQDERLNRYYKRELGKLNIEGNPLLETEPQETNSSPTAPRRRVRFWVQAIAAILILGLGIGVYRIYREGVPRGHHELAEIQAVQGRVQLLLPLNETNKGESLQTLKIGSSILQSQRIKVANGAYAALKLNDGNILEARSGTQLSLHDFPSRLEVALNGGQVWAHLDRPPLKPFVVTTPHLKATAVGTVFSVEQGMDRSVVTVAKGKVLVECGGTQTSLAAGEQFSSRAGAEARRMAETTNWSQHKEDMASLAKTPEPAPTPGKTSSPSSEAALTETRAFAPSVAAPPVPQGGGMDNLVDLLPKNTRYFLDVRNWSELRKEFGRTDYAALTNEPNIRAWWNNIEGGKVLSELSSHIHLSIILELSKLVDGQVVIGGDPKGNFLLAADCETHEKEVRETLRRLTGEVLAQDAKNNPAGANRPNTGPDIGDEVEKRMLVERGVLIISTNPKLAKETQERIIKGERTGFADSKFRHKLIRNVNNPPFIAGVDLGGVIREQLPLPETQPSTATLLTAEQEQFIEMLGLRGIDYLLISPSFQGRGINQAAQIGFEGDRYGVMSWLGEPSTMRGLEFFSPDVHFFASAIVANPSETLIQYLLFLQNTNQNQNYDKISTFLADYQDLLKGLGGEIDIAVENPLLPIPNIKIVVEMADRKAIEEGLARLTEAIRQKWDATGTLSYLEQTEYRGYTVNTIYVTGLPINLSYAFVNDYLVMGPGKAFVESSIEVYASRRSIANDSRMISLLPGKADMNFSFLVYQDIAKAIPSLIQSKIAPKLNAEELKKVPDMNFLERYRAPGIAYAVARRSTIDLFLSTPKGVDFNMGMAVPMIANWLSQKSDPTVIAKKYAAAQFALDEVKTAVEKYQTDKKKLPASLSDLVGTYIDKVPDDPFGLREGDTLRFTKGPNPDQIIIYSIGPDETDDQARFPYELGKTGDISGDILIRIPDDQQQTMIVVPAAGGK